MRWCLPIIALLAFAVALLLLREWEPACDCQEVGVAPVPMYATVDMPRFRM